MTIKALSLGTTFDFTSATDDPNDPTIFKLGVLSSRDVGELRDMVTKFSMNSADASEVMTSIDRSKMNFEAVRRGLHGWSNFIDADGKPVEYQDQSREIGGVQRRVVLKDLLGRIPLGVINEMADKILAENTVEEVALGNSPAPSTDE